MIKETITISITPEEKELVKKLKEEQITQVAIFRRGLAQMKEDYINEVTKNNIL